MKGRKDSATTFLRLCATGKVEEAYRLVSRNFRPHNPAHIFRFKGEEIAELWDIAMEQPGESPNENGMF